MTKTQLNVIVHISNGCKYRNMQMVDGFTMKQATYIYTQYYNKRLLTSWSIDISTANVRHLRKRGMTVQKYNMRTTQAYRPAYVITNHLCMDFIVIMLSYNWYHAIHIAFINPWASYHIRKIPACACARNARNAFPATAFNGNRGLAIPVRITARAWPHVPWCMSGSLTCGGGENVPGACATRNFTYLSRGPLN